MEKLPIRMTRLCPGGEAFGIPGGSFAELLASKYGRFAVTRAADQRRWIARYSRILPFMKYLSNNGLAAAPIARALPPTAPASTRGAINPRMSWLTR